MKPSQSLVDEAKRELATVSLTAYCERMDPTYESAPHTLQIVEVLEALERGDIEKAMIFLPPRHGKSYHCSERFPAWYEGKHPTHAMITASYGARLAMRFSRRARNLFDDERSPFESRVAKDSHAADRWHTDQGGEVISAGVDGSATGYGAHLFLIDDPFKNRKEADSPTMRENVWEWYQEVATTRMMRGGKRLIMNTRWHDDDLCGRVLNSAGASEWYVLSLPVYNEDGSRLWENGPPIPDPAKGEISRRGFSALYMQQPEPDEGLLFKDAWLRNRWTPDALGGITKVLLLVDGAWKTGVGNDYSAFAVWGTDGRAYYLLDGDFGKYEYYELKQHTKALWARYKERFPLLRQMVVEDKASGTALVSDLKKTTGIPIVSFNPGTDSKYARAEGVTPEFESGLVLVPPIETPWLDEWRSQHKRFTGADGNKDDFVDTSSMAIVKLRSTSGFTYGKIDTARR